MKKKKEIRLEPKDYYQKVGLPSKWFLISNSSYKYLKDKNTFQNYMSFNYYLGKNSNKSFIFTDDEIKEKLNINKDILIHLSKYDEIYYYMEEKDI